FFYRQMPDLISQGHLFIAQPPLYKVKRGSSEQYLKDERALEDYLVGTGLEDAALHAANGEVRTGADLGAVVDEARTVRQLLQNLPSRYRRDVVEQAAIAGALNAQVVADREHAAEAAAYVARRLDALAESYERGWKGEARPDGSLVFTRELRGVKEAAEIDPALIASADARKLDERAASLQAVYEKPGLLKRREVEIPVFGPIGLFEAVLAAGRKGVALQRYKGLGEMNPEQLWETTLDLNARSLLQVKVKELDEADDIFAKLMGDVVEPRREFIQQNALNVVNLDV
ncbi:MAG: DNA gyrase subunit B, partial [Pseudomonadota bacterium]|nr:DNA gyrase subunit B [Pseudomonadota bacterium]